MIPDPILQIGRFEVHMYGVMIAVGILAAFIVLYVYGKKIGIHEKFIDFIYYNAMVSIAVGFGASALFQSLYNYIENPEQGFRLGGGITFIGGLIGGAATFLLAYLIFRKKLNGKLYEAISLLPCCLMIGHAFGRIGCFFAGCCHGSPTSCALGVKFPNVPNTVHPTQLYEATFLVLLFAVCSYLLLKKKFRHNMSVYLIAYGTFRFINEFLRGDHRGEFVMGITPSQFWALLMVALGIALIFVINYLVKKNASAALLTDAGEQKTQEETTDEQ